MNFFKDNEGNVFADPLNTDDKIEITEAEALALANPTPTQAEILESEISDIKAQLEEADSLGARPVMAITAAIANGQQPDSTDVEQLNELETAKIALRESLAVKETELNELN